jgi:hypothetical protein
MEAYTIWCEYDMPFTGIIFLHKERAEREIDEADWEGLCGVSAEEARTLGFVSIDPVSINEEKK